MKNNLLKLKLVVGLGLWLVMLVGVGFGQATSGNYPTTVPITVQEADGSPKVVMPSKLVFPNGSLSIAGRVVTITLSGGGGTTINSTNGQLPYRVNSTTFGDSAFASNALNSTYLSATSGASGAGLTLAVAGGGTNENLILIPKGTGSILIASGSASAPAIAFLAETNMGIYRRSTGQLAVTIGGTDKAIIDANSLNFSSLQYLTLGSVSINNSASNILRLHNTSGTTGSQILLGTSSDTISAQLDVRSQSTTRPAGRFQAASGTTGTQEMLGGYDGSGGKVWGVQADGTFMPFGGTSASFPALKRSGAGLQVRLADDTGYASIAASIVNLDKTITAGGTTGAQTINKSSGTVNFAAAATSLVVTNSLVTTSSNIICTVQTNDATMKDAQCVPGSGSFTIYANAAATAETRVGFVIFN